MSFIINPYRFSAGGSGGALDDLILASSPAYYYRLAEASGAVMVDSGLNALNGTYTPSFPGGNAALYPGGPTSALFRVDEGRFGFASVNGGTLVDLNSLTVLAVVKLNDVSGLKGIINRDESGAGRKFQFRANGTGLDFVKISGGVTSATASGVFTAGVACMVAATVSAAGSIKLYKNGVLKSTTASAATNYGGVGDRLCIGYSAGGSVRLQGFASECVIWGAELSAATLLSFASAAGF